MKKTTNLIIAGIMALLGNFAAYGETYSYSVDMTTPVFSEPDGMTQKLGGIDWTASYVKSTPFKNFYCYAPIVDGDTDWKYGYAFGSGNSRLQKFTLSTADFTGIIKRVKVVTDPERGTTFTLNVMVDEVLLTATTANVSDEFSSNRWEYVYEGNAIGTLAIEWTNAMRNDFRLNMIEVETEPLPQCSTPEITPTDATITTQTEVSIACATNGAVIRYTTDGTQPDEESAVYSAPFKLPLGGAVTVTAIATSDSYAVSEPVARTYNVIAADGERGSQSRPYAVEAAIALASKNTQPEIWVKGYIVGALTADGEAIFAPEALDSGDILIADEAGETDPTYCMAVSRPVSRAAVNIGPDHYQTVLHLHGTLAMIDQKPYLTSVDQLDTPQYTAVVAVETDGPAANCEYFTLTGQQVNAGYLVPGIYICRRGATTSKIVVP